MIRHYTGNMRLTILSLLTVTGLASPQSYENDFQNGLNSIILGQGLGKVSRHTHRKAVESGYGLGGLSANRGLPGTYSNDVHYNKGGYNPCPTGLERTVHGKCVEPMVTQDLFVYKAPSYKVPYEKAYYDHQPKVHYNLVFIRSPTYEDHPLKPLVVPPPKQQTLVYLLSKKPHGYKQEVIEVSHEPKKPEVFFVHYKDGDNPVLPGGIDLHTALSQSHTLEETNIGGHGDHHEGFGGIGVHDGLGSSAIVKNVGGVGLESHGGLGLSGLVNSDLKTLGGAGHKELGGVDYSDYGGADLSGHNAGANFGDYGKGVAIADDHSIGGALHHDIGGTVHPDVGGAVHHDIGGLVHHDIGGAVHHDVGGAVHHDVGGAVHHDIGGSVHHDVGGAVHHDVGGAAHHDIAGAVLHDIAGVGQHDIGGVGHHDIGGVGHHDIGGAVHHDVGGASHHDIGGAVHHNVGGALHHDVGGALHHDVGGALHHGFGGQANLAGFGRGSGYGSAGISSSLSHLSSKPGLGGYGGAKISSSLSHLTTKPGRGGYIGRFSGKGQHEHHGSALGYATGAVYNTESLHGSRSHYGATGYSGGYEHPKASHGYY